MVNCYAACRVVGYGSPRIFRSVASSSTRSSGVVFRNSSLVFWLAALEASSVAWDGEASDGEGSNNVSCGFSKAAGLKRMPVSDPEVRGTLQAEPRSVFLPARMKFDSCPKRDPRACPGYLSLHIAGRGPRDKPGDDEEKTVRCVNPYARRYYCRAMAMRRASSAETR